MFKTRMGLRSKMVLQLGSALLVSFGLLLNFVSLRTTETVERSSRQFAGTRGGFRGSEHRFQRGGRHQPPNF